MRMLLAGNWKMNGLKVSLGEIHALTRAFAEKPPAADILVCPPATLVMAAVEAARKSPLAIGGQDCHAKPNGAFTGDVSAEMLRDAGAVAVIIGHSERRQYHDETDQTVAVKVTAAQRAGLRAILCVGESETDRNSGRAVGVVTAQLEASIPAATRPEYLVVAYEPIWAIGTGRTPCRAEILEMHAALAATLGTRFGQSGGEIRILYGGSVKPDNAAEILAIPHVHGALIGGASLKAADFLAIAAAVPGR